MAARAIAAAAFAAVAVYFFIRGVESGKKAVLSMAIISAASYLAVAGLFLVIREEDILFPALLGLILWALPAPRTADGRQ